MTIEWFEIREPDEHHDAVQYVIILILMPFMLTLFKVLCVLFKAPILLHNLSSPDF